LTDLSYFIIQSKRAPWKMFKVPGCIGKKRNTWYILLQ